MDKILFICEGASREKKFCNLIIDKYFIQHKKEKEFVAFGTNIYGLYDEMSRDSYLDIVQLVSEKAKNKKDMYTYNKLKMGGFSEVYLIFDFDCHATQYEHKKILEMIDFFDNETEHGKLYINYPMIESFKHFRTLPDYDYNQYKIHLSECSNYKEMVNELSIVKHFNDINEEKLAIIIKQNLDKYLYITNKDVSDYDSYLVNFAQKTLLLKQIKLLDKEENIYVLNTSVMWGIDYFGKTMFDNYNKINLYKDTVCS